MLARSLSHRKKVGLARLIALALVATGPGLAACSLAPIVAENSIDYNNTVEDVTMSVLITNVLRARDKAPLFFSDISLIRGSIGLDLSAQGAFPFGPRFGNDMRRTFQGGPLSANSTPGYDIAPLNTKQFYLGLLNPVSPNVLGYYLERGLPGAALLNLLVSRIDIYEDAEGGSRLVRGVTSAATLNSYFMAWTRAGRSRIHLRKSRVERPFGPPVKGDLGNMVTAAGQPNLSARGTGAAVQLVRSEDRPVLCASGSDGTYFTIGINQNSVTNGPSETRIPTNGEACKNLGRPQANGSRMSERYVITIRSVEAIFYYLGDLLKIDEASRPISFKISEDTVTPERIAVTYRGRRYSVAEWSERDDTVTILAVLSDLLNINRDANEIPSTRTVAVSQ